MTISIKADKLPNMHSTDFRGIPVVIQWPKGSIRVGERKDGTPFKTEMHASYGYIPDTVAAGDEERLDVYIGDNPDADTVYIVEQVRKGTWDFDEYKVMLGFNSLDEAEELYKYQLGDDADVELDDISEIPFDYLFDHVMQERHGDQEQEIEETESRVEDDQQKVGAATTEYQADAYIEWGGMYDHRKLTLDEYKGIYEWTDWDASNELNLGEQIGECSSAEEAKSKLEQVVFELGEPTTYIQFPEGAIKKKDYLKPTEKKFLNEVGVSQDIKPDYSDRTPKPKSLEYSEADKQRLKGLGVLGAHNDKLSVIDAFIKLYKHEMDYYEETAHQTAETLEDALTEAGIRAIVTFRAKKPRKLKAKLLKRNQRRQYQSFRDIYDDIVDLAGVRVALYLPADRDAVGQIIEQIFAPVRAPKNFPEDRGPGDGMGYVATHYLVQLRPETLHKDELRYADTNVEIQVASVLMHAWAEVTHDLIYKPEQGALTPAEHKMIDDLNVIVQQGESVLEQLQESVETRNNGAELRFELSAALTKLAKRLEVQSKGKAKKRITAGDVISIADRAIKGDPKRVMADRLQALGWKNQGFSDWSHPNQLQEVVQLFPDGWIHRSWDKIVGTGDTLDELATHLAEAGLGESYLPKQSNYNTYIKAKLALWKAHKADELDDRLRDAFQQNTQKPVGDPNRIQQVKAPDDPWILKAKEQLGIDPAVRMTPEQISQVINLAQRLKTQN